MTASPPGSVRLDVLGRLGLATAEGEVSAVLVQPKRIALLVWLALRRPGAFVRRDEVLGVFWPESTGERARASLRQALQFIRRHLGRDIISKRGAGELGVNTSLFSCDALAFLDAITRGDDAAALGNYCGDLMPGFLLDGAQEFDRWLNGERQRLRTLAVEAALRAAVRAEEADDWAAAAEWLARGQRLEPTDEEIARRLMRALERGGNRSAAMAVYDALADLLRSELDLEPSATTTELFARIRDAGPAGPASVPVPAGLSRQRVLVLDLENRTGEARFGVLGRLASETIARGLADLPDLVVIPPLAVGVLPGSSPEGGAPDGAIVLPAVAAAARRSGAGTLLDGSIHREGGALWFRVRATDLVVGRLLAGPEPVRVDEMMPLEGIEQLRERVVTAIAPELTHRAVHVRTAVRPPGIEAYRAYVDGHERFVAGEWSAALDRFRRSTALAPEYALPRVVSSIALWNLGELDRAQAIAREADAMRDSLGRFESAVLDMVLAWLAGDWTAAHRAVQVQAEMAPGSIPHFQVAEESRRLNHPRQARELLGQLDPDSGELRGWIFYWVELATANHLLRDHVRELEVASRCRQLHPHEPTAALLEARARAALGRERDVMRIVDQVLASPLGGKTAAGDLMFETALELGAHGSHAAGAELMERAVEWQRSASRTAPELRRLLGRALYYAGHLDEAWSIFDDLAATSHGRVQLVGQHHVQLSAHLDAGYLAAIAVQRGDAAAAERWCTYLQDLDTPFLYGAHWYWLAIVAAIGNDVQRAARMLGRAFAGGMPMELFIHAEPHIARLRGEPQLDAILRPRG